MCVCVGHRNLQKDFDLVSDCDPKRTLPTLLQGYPHMMNIQMCNHIKGTQCAQ